MALKCQREPYPLVSLLVPDDERGALKHVSQQASGILCAGLAGAGCSGESRTGCLQGLGGDQTSADRSAALRGLCLSEALRARQPHFLQGDFHHGHGDADIAVFTFWRASW